MAFDQDNLRDTLKQILDEKLDEKLAPLIRSVDYLSGQFDDLKAKTSKLEESNRLLQKDNKCLQEEILKLNREIKQQSIAINNQEQYSRRECIEIRGIPTTPSEDTDEIVKNVGKLIDVVIDKSDISVSHRIPVRSTQTAQSGGNMPTPVIIVKFVKRDTRDKVYKARAKLKNHTTADLGLGCVWGNTYDTALKPISVLQKKTMRIMTFSRYDEHSSPLFRALKILKIADVIHLQNSMLLYNYHSKILPSVFDNFFQTVASVHHYNTRLAAKSSYYIPYAKTNYGKFNIRYRGAKIWNALDEKTKSLPRTSFKNKIVIDFLNSY